MLLAKEDMLTDIVHLPINMSMNSLIPQSCQHREGAPGKETGRVSVGKEKRELMRGCLGGRGHSRKP